MFLFLRLLILVILDIFLLGFRSVEELIEDRVDLAVEDLAGDEWEPKWCLI
jgi:hypothetical protein